jgi:hypothetical protein
MKEEKAASNDHHNLAIELMAIIKKMFFCCLHIQ